MSDPFWDDLASLAAPPAPSPGNLGPPPAVDESEDLLKQLGVPTLGEIVASTAKGDGTRATNAFSKQPAPYGVIGGNLPTAGGMIANEAGAAAIGYMAPAARAFGFGDIADAGQREAGSWSQANEMAHGGNIAARAGLGIARSLTQAAMNAGTAHLTKTGVGGVIALNGIQAADQALVQAKDAGLDDAAAARHAIVQGLIEAGITTLFQGLGHGGLESILGNVGKKVAAETGFKAALKSAAKATRDELLEENAITQLSNAFSKYTDVDKTPWTLEEALAAARDTSLATLGMMGVASTAKAAAQRLAGRPMPAAEPTSVQPQPALPQPQREQPFPNPPPTIAPQPAPTPAPVEPPPESVPVEAPLTQPAEAPAARSPEPVAPPKATPKIGDVEADWFTSQIPGSTAEDHEDGGGWKLRTPSGHEIDVRVHPSIERSADEVRKTYGADRISEEADRAGSVRVYGMFRDGGQGVSGLGLITLSQQADQEHARHELIHAAMRGLVTPEERAELVGKYSPGWEGKNPLQQEEDVAQAIAPTSRKGRERVAGNRLVHRAKTFIGNLARKMGLGGLLGNAERARSIEEELGAPGLWQRAPESAVQTTPATATNANNEQVTPTHAVPPAEVQPTPANVEQPAAQPPADQSTAHHAPTASKEFEVPLGGLKKSTENLKPVTQQPTTPISVGDRVIHVRGKFKGQKPVTRVTKKTAVISGMHYPFADLVRNEAKPEPKPPVQKAPQSAKAAPKASSLSKAEQKHVADVAVDEMVDAGQLADRVEAEKEQEKADYERKQAVAASFKEFNGGPLTPSDRKKLQNGDEDAIRRMDEFLDQFQPGRAMEHSGVSRAEALRIITEGGVGPKPKFDRARVAEIARGLEPPKHYEAVGADEAFAAETEPVRGKYSESGANLSLRDFANHVRRLARSAKPADKFYDNKAFISGLWRSAGKDKAFAGLDLTLDEFKSNLIRANSEHLLHLSRADMVPNMNPAQVKASETNHLNSQFHFVLIEPQESFAAEEKKPEGIRDAMRRIEPGADRGALVPFRELRKALPGLSKAEFDRKVLQLARGEALSLHKVDDAGTRTPEQLAELVPGHEPGTYYIGAAIRQKEAYAAEETGKGSVSQQFKAHAARLWTDKTVELPKHLQDAEIEKYRGAPRQGWKERWAERAKLLIHAYTRRNIHLKENGQFAKWIPFFRKLDGIPQKARARVLSLLNRSLEKLKTPEDFRVFERYLVFKDMLHAAETLNQSKYGFEDADQIKERIADFDRFIEKPENLHIRAALKDREAARREVVEQLVHEGLLEADALSNDAYFHRQVFSAAEQRFGSSTTGLGGIREKRRAFQKARTEDLEGAEHNVNYFESEAAWMHDALMELAKSDLMETKLKPADKYSRFKKQADAKNFETLVGGPAVVKQIMALRAERDAIRDQEGGLDGTDKKQIKIINEQLWNLDPTSPYRQRIAMARSMLTRAGFDDAEDMEKIAEFAERWKGHVVPEDREKWNEFDKQVIGARTFLKAAHDKAAFIEKELGNKFRTWEHMLDDHNAGKSEDDQLKAWYVKENNVFYKAFTLPDRMVQQLTAGLMKAIDVTSEDLKQVLAMGNKGRPYILPGPVVDQLETLTRAPSTGNPTLDKILKAVIEPARAAQSVVKQYLLHNPKAIVSYNIGNISTDASIYASHPGMRKFLPQAWRELKKVDMGKLSFPNELAEAAFEHDVLGIGQSSEARTNLDYESLPDFSRFKGKTWRGLPARAVKGYFRKAADVSQAREDATRYGAFLYFRDRLAAKKLEFYGASKRDVVDALLREEGLDAAAAYMARNEFGDYGGSSVAAKWMTWLMPFYRWNESVFRRVPRTFINAWDAGNTRAIASTTGRLGLQAAKPLALYYLGRLLLPQLATWVWNNFVMGDDEDKLSKQQQQRPHLNLGHWWTGSPMTVQNPTLLGEFMSYFGADQAFNQLHDYFLPNGSQQVDLKGLPGTMAKGAVNRFVQAVHPVPKLTAETATGYTTYPDVFAVRQRPRDEILMQQLRLSDEYMDLKGKLFGTGERGRKWDTRLANFLVRVHEAEDSALEDVLGAREKFLKSKGLEVETGHGVSQFRTMRHAADNDDFQAFTDARKTWIDASPRHAYKSFQMFLSKRDPLAGVSKDLRGEFVNDFLDNRQRQQLDIARDYAARQRDKLWVWWKKAGEKDSREVRERFEAAEETELVTQAGHLAAVPPGALTNDESDRAKARAAGMTPGQWLSEKREKRQKEIDDAREWFSARMQGTSPQEVIQAAERARAAKKISAPALTRLRAEMRRLQTAP